MVQESWLDTVCTTEKLKPRSAIKGTLRGVRGGENSPYSITGDEWKRRSSVFVAWICARCRKCAIIRLVRFR